MSYVPVVLGIKPHLPRSPCTDIEIIYRSGNLQMLLDNIPEKKAKKQIEKHGLVWSAHRWRWMDRLSDWEAV